MLNLDGFNLYDLVPDSIRDDPSIKASIDALNGEIQQVTELCNTPAIWSRIDELDGLTLDHLAWWLDSKVWRDSWPVEFKRMYFKTIPEVKRRKGTRFAVEKAVESLGSMAVLKEWWEYDPPRKPHTFSVTVTLSGVGGTTSAETQRDVIKSLNDAKPARALYDFTLGIQSTAGVGFIGVARPAVYARISGIQAD